MRANGCKVDVLDLQTETLPLFNPDTSYNTKEYLLPPLLLAIVFWLTLTMEERSRLERHAPPPDVYPQRMLIEQSGLPARLSPPLRAR